MLMELSRTPRTSVARLAARYEVSERTIQRDIGALHEMGVPVWTRTGPAGGVGIVEGWRSPITGMTADELRTLFIGGAASRDLGMAADFDNARMKILAASSGWSDSVAPTEERFLLDNEDWFSASVRPGALTTVAGAVWSGRRLGMIYHKPGGHDAGGERVVDPLGLVLKTDTWYLVAAHRRRVRTYRLSRISSARVHDELARRPSGFSLPQYWARSRAQFEASIHRLPVRVSIPVGSSEHLVSAVPGAATREAVDAAVRSGERLEVDLLMEREAIATAQLLAVPGVEVLEPRHLRDALFERAEDLASRNRPNRAVTRSRD